MGYFELEEIKENNGARIKVIGVGGGGGNAINTMIAEGLKGVEFVSANTDFQSLSKNKAQTKLQLGLDLTRGLGAGGIPEVGKKSALEDQEKIAKFLDGTDMVFVTAGMGGGTGTGAAPVIADIARKMGILTVGVVTKPFKFEAKRRMKQAEEGIRALKEAVDTLIVIPNQRLLSIADENMSFISAFKKADEVLFNAVQGVSSIINDVGLINRDFADVKNIMSNKGVALMGTGTADGDKRAIQAAEQAISSPLLEDVSIEGAMGILVNITGPSNLTLFEINEAMELITNAAHEDAEILFGAVTNEEMENKVKITVIATGFANRKEKIEYCQGYNSIPAYSKPVEIIQDLSKATQLNLASVTKVADPLESIYKTMRWPEPSKKADPVLEDDFENPAINRKGRVTSENENLEIPTIFRTKMD